MINLRFKNKTNIKIRVGDILLLSLIVPKIKFKNKLKKRKCWHNKMRPIKKNVKFLLSKKSKIWRKKLKFGICFLCKSNILGIRRVFRKRTGVIYNIKVQAPNVILIDILKKILKKVIEHYYRI